MARILVTGYASGVGAELTRQLADAGNTILGVDRKIPPSSSAAHVKFMVDVTSPEEIDLAEDVGSLDILVNAAGVNFIDWLEDVSEDDWDEVMDVNAKGIFKMTQHFLPLLKASKGTVLNIVSNASHMPMRCSAAYNASKGAAHILTLQLARELTSKHGVTVFGISPNRLAGTAMSDSIDEQVLATRGWTRTKAREYQLSSLLAGEETPVDTLCEFITFLLSSKERHMFLTGCVLPYGA